MKYIIIGGVAGGATAAARIRRNTEKAEIILFEKGEYISYANCGLPYYIGGVIEDRERLFVQTPESFGKRFNIDIRTRSEVTAIDVKKKEVTVRSSGKTYTESYDKLLLSPGASPVRPPLPGIDTEGIFTLRNVNDTDRIKSYMQQKAVKRAVIVGGGFIGLINQRLSHPEISQLHTVYSHRLFLFYRKSLRQEKRFCRQTHFRKQIGSLRTTGFLLSSTKQKGGNSSSLVCRMYKQAVQIAIASYRYKSSNLARRLADSCQEMQIARKQFLPTGRCGTLHPCFHLTRSIIFTASNAYCFFKYRR